MLGRCALRLRQRIRFAHERWFFSRRSAAGSSSLVTRRRQIHAPCETKAGNGHKRRSLEAAHSYGVLGYKGACRKRLARRTSCEVPIRLRLKGRRTNARRRWPKLKFWEIRGKREDDLTDILCQFDLRPCVSLLPR